MLSGLFRALKGLFWTGRQNAESPDAVVDRAGPFYFADLYWADDGDNPDFVLMGKDPQWCGVILKATQGTSYSKTPWFIRNLKRAKEAGEGRYGRDWFVGAYHYLNLRTSGAAQADYYLRTCERAGVKWDDGGTILPIVDVELGGEGSANQGATKAEIEKCVTDFADRVFAKTGRRPILYGRGAMRDRGIRSKMGCVAVWNPSYTAKMVTNGLEAWNVSDVVLWQYGEAGKTKAQGYPSGAPGLRDCQVSKFIDGPRPTTLLVMKEKLTGA